MKIIQNVTVYKCDFCRKKLFREHAMKNHEKICGANPVNNRPCLGCPLLMTKDIEYDVGDDCNGDPITVKGTAFYCEAKEEFLLHPKVNLRKDGEGLRWVWFEGAEVKQENMPSSCDIDINEFFDKITF